MLRAAQRAQECAGHFDNRGLVEAHDGFVLLIGEVGGWEAAHHRTGIVDQHIDVGKQAVGSLQKGTDAAFLQEIRIDDMGACFRNGIFQEIGQRTGGGPAAMQQHARAAVEELPGDLQPDATTRAGNDDIGSLEQGWMKHALSSRYHACRQYHKKRRADQEGIAGQLMWVRFCI